MSEIDWVRAGVWLSLLCILLYALRLWFNGRRVAAAREEEPEPDNDIDHKPYFPPAA